jgi:hypothetical protein
MALLDSLRDVGRTVQDIFTDSEREKRRRREIAANNARIRQNQAQLRNMARQGNQRAIGSLQAFQRQNIVPTRIPQTSSLLKSALSDSFTKPSVWQAKPFNVGSFRGSGLVEDFLNSPFKVGKGIAQVGSGDVKRGLGTIGTGLIEGPAGFIPVARVGQLAKGASLGSRIASGARVGAKEGGIFSGAYGASQAASEGRSNRDILASGALGAGAGVVGGAVLGGASPIAGATIRTASKGTRDFVVQTPRTLRTLTSDQVGSIPRKATKNKLPLNIRSSGKYTPAERKAIGQIAGEKGLTPEQAIPEYHRILKESTNIQSFSPGLREISRPKKDADVKSVLRQLGNARNAASSEADLTSNIIRTAARKNKIKLDRNFIDRYQTGSLKTPQEKAVAKVIKDETDRIFSQQQIIDPRIEYRKNYVPQVYEQPKNVVEDAVRQLQTRTGASQRRSFNTYQEAREFGLRPRYDSLDQIIGENASSARRALGNRQAVAEGLEKGIFTNVPDRKLATVEGFYDEMGAPIYAQKKVADIINGTLQESTTGLSKLLKKSARLNGIWQDIALAGGVPYTPINAFVMNQAFKDLASGRVSVVKDLVYSMSRKATEKRFAQNAPFVRKMADRGVRFNVQSGLENEAGITRGLWAKMINEPTFQRYMPNQYLTVAENVFKKASKKMPEEQALNLAAETTKRFYGIIDPVVIGRDTNAQNLIGALFFAPRYRESVLHTLANTGRSILPQNLGKKEFSLNRRMFLGMAVTLYGYNELNKQINGHGMFDNRKGQELSLQIPYGQKDDKGNQPVFNLPFMPGFMTIPRSAFNSVKGLLDGNLDIAGTEAGKLASLPIQTGSQILGNRDYFSRPIYVNQKVADEEGLPVDSPLDIAKKVGTYLAKQSTPSYVRGGIELAQGSPKEQVAAQAIEAPIRFGKVLNKDTEAYIDLKDKLYAGANKNQKSALDQLFPQGKNVLGEEIKDTNPDDRIRKSTILRNQDTFSKVSDFYKKLKGRTGQSIDPIYELDWNKAQGVLWARSLPPGESSDTKNELLYGQPWYKSFSNKEQKYYDSLEKKFGKRDDPYNYPKETPQLNAIQETYYKLPKGTGDRSNFIDAHPELLTYWDKRREATNRHRVAIGLPPMRDEEFTSGSSSFSKYSRSGSRGSRGGGNIEQSVLDDILREMAGLQSPAKFRQTSLKSKIRTPGVKQITVPGQNQKLTVRKTGRPV